MSGFNYRYLLNIILGLRVPQLGVLSAFVAQQLFMRTVLHYAAALKHGDFVAELARGEAVANENGGFVADNFIKFAIDFSFSYGVEGSRVRRLRQSRERAW